MYSYGVFHFENFLEDYCAISWPTNFKSVLKKGSIPNFVQTRCGKMGTLKFCALTVRRTFNFYKPQILVLDLVWGKIFSSVAKLI